MLPLLKMLEDNADHPLRETIENLAGEFGLTSEERRKLQPSGRQAIFDNRVGWARTYLKKAGLLDTPKRGILHITRLGFHALAQKPEKIDVKFLEQFPGFLEFRSPETSKQDSEAAPILEEQTPQELLDRGYQQIRQNLASELLAQILTCSPTFFERLVVELLLKMGYGNLEEGAGIVTPLSGDQGIDGIIYEDRLGLEAIYIQAKKWDKTRPVGRPEIQQFAGALQGQKARKGVFITTSSFSREARDYANSIQNKIVLVDGGQLAELMMDFDVGVSKVTTYDVKRVDSDYFMEE